MRADLPKAVSPSSASPTISISPIDSSSSRDSGYSRVVHYQRFQGHTWAGTLRSLHMRFGCRMNFSSAGDKDWQAVQNIVGRTLPILYIFAQKLEW
jgi:hypothetical protein